MITFFILLVLYCGLFPFLGYHIVQRRIKRIGRLRVIINTKYTAYTIGNIFWSWTSWDETLIPDLLSGNIDTKLLRRMYHKLYGEDLNRKIQDEMNGEAFNKAWKLVNQ